MLCLHAEPRTSLDLIPAPQCRTPKPVDDTAAGDLLSLARCSETGVNVVALLLYFDDFLCHAVKPHWSKPTRNFFFFFFFFCLSENVVRPKPDRPDCFRWPCTHIILQATDTGESWQQGYKSVHFVAQNNFLHWGVVVEYIWVKVPFPP